MKHLFQFSLLLLVLLLPATAHAHDFEVDGIYYNINGNEATVTYKGTSPYQYYDRYLGSVIIPSTVTLDGTTYSVTSIGYAAFLHCNNLTNITIPTSVTSIGDDAFGGCNGLTNVTIPNSVTYIGNSTFNACNGLTRIEIPNSVTYIGSFAFAWCSSLASIIIPNTVTFIGLVAFYDTPWYDNQPDGLVYVGLVAYAYKGTMPSGTSIIIKEGTRCIAGGAFNYCSGLTSIDIPNSVTSIGGSAFLDCSGLTNITIPNSVTSIDGYAFSGCSGLTSVTMGNSVTSIGEEAFSGCSNLIEFYSLAFTPPTIDSSTFNGCNGATLYVPNDALDIYIAADYWKEFTNIESITFEVDSKCYRVMDESSLSVIANNDEGSLYSGDVVIPDSVTYEGYTFAVTGIEDNAFDGCFELTSIAIPNSVETIGEQAFQGCTGLKSVTIGSGVMAIGAKAFNYCNALETVKCLGAVPPVMASTDCFSTAAYNRATLLVPRNTEATYTAADYWYKFAHIDGWGSAGRGDIDGDGVVSINDVTRMIDAILTGEHEGVYFESADLNSNGRLDIGDVTTIIDMLLNGESLSVNS